MGFFKKIFGEKKTEPPAKPNHEFLSLYPDQYPFHYGAGIRFQDGGPDPLSGVSIFWNDDGPHWHYLSFGLSEFGYDELSFRLTASTEAKGDKPQNFLGSIAYNAPTWPIGMLNMLGRRLLRTNRPFKHGDWWQGQPGILQPHSDIEALVFARDPELTLLTIPEYNFEWLLVHQITLDSIEEIKRDEIEGRGDSELERLFAKNPLLVS